MLYVVILSAALDLVGANVPKGVVLLVNVLPGFLIKLCGPYFIHAIPYASRILLLASLSTMGMLLIALTAAYTDSSTIATRMAGVVLASLSSGGGELSFLGLTHFYGPFSLAAWGSGTGGAGLFGAGAYAVATTSLGLGVQKTLLWSSGLPAVMLIAFFVVLPREPLNQIARAPKYGDYTQPSRNEQSEDNLEEDNPRIADHEDEGLLRTISRSSSIPHPPQKWQSRFVQNLRRSRSLFFP